MSTGGGACSPLVPSKADVARIQQLEQSLNEERTRRLASDEKVSALLVEVAASNAQRQVVEQLLDGAVAKSQQAEADAAVLRTELADAKSEVMRVLTKLGETEDELESKLELTRHTLAVEKLTCQEREQDHADALASVESELRSVLTQIQGSETIAIASKMVQESGFSP